MMNPGWKEEKRRPEKKKLYMEIEQPTMKTWIEKTQVMTMLTQARDKKPYAINNVRKRYSPDKTRTAMEAKAQWNKKIKAKENKNEHKTLELEQKERP